MEQILASHLGRRSDPTSRGILAEIRVNIEFFGKSFKSPPQTYAVTKQLIQAFDLSGDNAVSPNFQFNNETRISKDRDQLSLRTNDLMQ